MGGLANRPTAVAVLLATSFKILLVPSYRSTDFEVHRNWLAITSSLPIGQWYTDATSEWTLDYPPFFAWFERLLAVFARFADPEMLRVENLGYASPATVVFQRCTVIAADAVLVLGALAFTHGKPEPRRACAVGLCILSPGLLMVDHIHFQYNGFVIGLYLLSLAAFRKGWDLTGTLLFGVLLNFKHLFGFAAPVIAVHLLARHWRSPRMLAGFALQAAAVGAASLGPFVASGQMKDVLGRLFPFGRGLTHAYWAPNVWALYYGADKALSVALKLSGASPGSSVGNLTGGLVGDGAKPSFLPVVTPAASAVLVLLSMAPALREAARGDPARLPLLASFAAACTFGFGWHVHEKAALMFSIPLGLNALDTADMSAEFLFLSTIAHASLSPLLFEPREWPIKVLLIWGNLGVLWVAMGSVHGIGAGAGTAGGGASRARRLLSTPRAMYVVGLFLLELYRPMHDLIWKGCLPFLPLLVTSVYCAAGNAVAFRDLAKGVLRRPTSAHGGGVSPAAADDEGSGGQEPQPAVKSPTRYIFELDD